jgi:hypothetical protein
MGEYKKPVAKHRKDNYNIHITTSKGQISTPSAWSNEALTAVPKMIRDQV